METLIRKLTSRKFWAAVVNFVTQLLLAFRVAESDVAKTAAVIMAGAGVIAYIIGEGLTDAANASGKDYYYEVHTDEKEKIGPDSVIGTQDPEMGEDGAE